MAIFKIEKCECGYKHNEPNPCKANKTCPKCGKTMRYLDNWRISYQLYGKKYIEATGPQRRFAQDALGKRKTAIRENRFFDIKNSNITWAEATDKLKKTYHSLSAPSKRMYDNSLTILERKGFDRLRFSDITTDRINDYIEDRLDEDVTNSTINRELATLKRIAKLCKLFELHNDIQLLPENEARTRFLTEEEQQTLLASCESQTMRLAVLIALNTGLRRQGVYHLQWENIDFKSMTINRTVKGNRKVHIPLTETLANALREHRQASILSRYVFPSPVNAGEAIRADNHRPFKNACIRAGITDIRFHDLRHTFASWFLVRTKDLKALQDILGHTDLKMTNRYTHLLDEHKREAMKKFEAGGLYD